MTSEVLDRRRVLGGAAGLGLVGLGGCATTAAPTAIAPTGRPVGFVDLAPIRADPRRIFDITVCLRPFRAAGPRLDAEEIGDAFVVHNYGHGGSGWSLSWGSGTLAVQKALSKNPREIAVIGCGALGLTAGILAQQAGCQVTIYAKDLLPQTRSSRATGTWSPDSRIALAGSAPPGFPALWEQMTRVSFKTYRSYLGLPGAPVEWTDRYTVDDGLPSEPGPPRNGPTYQFADFRDRIRDITPAGEVMPMGSTPFGRASVRRSAQMMFNIASYGHTLMTDFYAAGGRVVRREFREPGELAQLREKVIINCPGYGARALWRDESIVPVRGEIAWLPPQADAHYGLYYRDVSVLARTDGILFQPVAGGDMRGYGDDNESPDRAEAEKAVATIAELYERLRAAA